MMQKFKIEDLECVLARANAGVGAKSAGRTVYMIYPMLVEMSDTWIQEMADTYGADIVMVYVPAADWNNYLTPWPEPGETSDSPPFGGGAEAFRHTLESKVVAEVEKITGPKDAECRYLVGVSLSGLYTLWQWMQSEVFGSIGCLSGSFWYEGFMEWFSGVSVPDKKGKAYFLLGTAEPHAHIKAYRSVGVNTEAVVARLKKAGIAAEFEWVPGNHFSDPVGRAERALKHLLA